MVRADRGGSTKYYVDDAQALTSAVVSCLHTQPDQGAELRRLGSINEMRRRNIRLVEAAAYSQILLGDRAATTELLKLAENTVPSYPWVQEVLDRMTGFGDVLASKGLARLRDYSLLRLTTRPVLSASPPRRRTLARHRLGLRLSRARRPSAAALRASGGTDALVREHAVHFSTAAGHAWPKCLRVLGSR